MTRLERNVNITAVVVPFLGVLVAAALLWNHFLGPRDLAIFGVMYALTAIGVTVGFHRLLTHRAFETHRWLRYTLAVLGSMSVQGPVIDWVADHRKHHTFTDEEGDPHSPHAGHGAGLRGMVAGLTEAGEGRLSTSPAAPSSVCSVMSTTARRKFGSSSAGDAIRSWPSSVSTASPMPAAA